MTFFSGKNVEILKFNKSGKKVKLKKNREAWVFFLNTIKFDNLCIFIFYCFDFLFRPNMKYFQLSANNLFLFYDSKNHEDPIFDYCWKAQKWTKKKLQNILKRWENCVASLNFIKFKFDVALNESANLNLTLNFFFSISFNILNIPLSFK